MVRLKEEERGKNGKSSGIENGKVETRRRKLERSAGIENGKMGRRRGERGKIWGDLKELRTVKWKERGTMKRSR